MEKMRMKKFLCPYEKGCFFFSIDDGEKLSSICNAPKKDGGIYIIHNDANDQIIYIGACGKLDSAGNFCLRNKGMFDRLVYGKQFGGTRNISWPKKMRENNISKIRVEWYVTFTDRIKHIPSYVEGVLLQCYFEVFKCLPKWNKKF